MFLKLFNKMSNAYLILKNKYSYYYFLLEIRFSKLIKKQVANPLSIPIIIINFNQLHFLEKLVNFFLDRGHENIVIVDNKSSYPPLLEYYNELKSNSNITIEMMSDNFGHMVFFNNKSLQKKYGKGFYFLTDADILPNDNLPLDFFEIMLKFMKNNFVNITKVGFALDINSIPDYYPNKQNVIKWESSFWENELEHNVFHSLIDTTFALYKPGYPKKYSQNEFLYAIRISDNFTAKHGGWYVDYNNLTDEQLYFQKTANSSSSWNINENGEMSFLAKKHYK